MAKGRRGGRPQQARKGGNPALPGQRGRKRKEHAPQREIPTAAPGAADAPAGSSLFGGGNLAVRTVPGVQRPQQRSRGGPRSEPQRRGARGATVMHDFRYVGADLRWIALTTVVSAAVVLILWAAIRL